MPVFFAKGAIMQAFVSDQSGAWTTVVLGAGPDFTVTASLKLPPGSWVVFVTAAFGRTNGGGTGVSVGFLINGQLHGQLVNSDLSGAGFVAVPLTTGLVLDAPTTLQIGCIANKKDTIASLPTTITAVQVESLTRIVDTAL
jgi:hypothetical protein